MPDDFDLDRDAEAAARAALAEALNPATPTPDLAVGAASSLVLAAAETALPLQSKRLEAQEPQEPRSQRGVRRWVYTSGGQPLATPVEVTDDWSDAGREAPRTSEEEIYGHLTATDGTPLDTRRKHREYMEQRGLAMDSDYTETWAKKAKERERAFTDNRYDRERRIEHLKAAIEQNRNKRR